MKFSFSKTVTSLITAPIVLLGLFIPTAGTVTRAAAAGETTRTVCASGCIYTTIQAAVDAAPAGETIKGLSIDGVGTVNKDIAAAGAVNTSDGMVITGNKLVNNGIGITEVKQPQA